MEALLAGTAQECECPSISPLFLLPDDVLRDPAIASALFCPPELPMAHSKQNQHELGPHMHGLGRDSWLQSSVRGTFYSSMEQGVTVVVYTRYQLVNYQLQTADIATFLLFSLRSEPCRL
jgi:hypothetical protein